MRTTAILIHKISSYPAQQCMQFLVEFLNVVDI